MGPRFTGIIFHALVMDVWYLTVEKVVGSPEESMPAAPREAKANARELIDGASFGPDALTAIGEAFDAAWTDIAGNFGDDFDDVEKARQRLAKVMLSIANEASRDVAVLKRAALQRMALDYRRRVGSHAIACLR